MEAKKYKMETKMAACTEPPWRNLIDPSDRAEILRLIRQECIDIYGYDFDVCPNSKTCLEKKCMGRPLPWKSELAQPYLVELKKTQTFIDNKETGEEELQIVTNCKDCKIYGTCKSLCSQVNNFLERELTREPPIYYRENLENLTPSSMLFEPANFKVTNENLAWDVLSKDKQEVIKKYLYDERDYRVIAEKLGLYNQSYAKYKFYYALTRLAKFSIIRMFLEKDKDKLTPRQKQIMTEVFVNMKTYRKIAKELKITPQAVQEIVARVVKNNNIKWPKFVKKIGGKVVYNVPTLFK